MTNLKNILEKIVLIIYVALFSFVIADVILNPQGLNVELNTVYSIMAVLIAAIISISAVFIFRKIQDKISFFHIFIWMGLILMQIICIKIFAVRYEVETWDMGVVYNAAKYFADNGIFSQQHYDYFLLFPNNSGLYNIFVVLFRIFNKLGIENTQLALNIFNTILIDLSVLFVDKSLVLLTDKSCKGIAVLICAMLCPFTFYSVLAYTDTFSLIFVALAVYFYIRILKEKGNVFVNVIVFSLSVAIGANLKFSVMILLIAAIIDFVLKNKFNKNSCIIFILVTLLTTGSYLGLRNVVYTSPYLPEYDYNYSIPYTHWVMMGLNGLGGYSDDDYQNITLQYPDISSRMKANIEEIENRVKEKGVDGMITHIKNKLSFIYSDGTFSACYKLDRAVLHPSPYHEYVIYCGSKYKPLAYLSLGMLISTIIYGISAAIFSIKRKNIDILMPMLSLIGVTLFLLIWEARTRYLFNFLPVFVILAGFGIKQIIAFFDNKKTKNKV